MLDILLGLNWTDEQRVLCNMMIASHAQAAERNAGNCSSLIMDASFAGSGSPIQAIAATILSTGDKHAPVCKAREYLFDRKLSAAQVISNGDAYPGFGNSLFKDRIDPSFSVVAAKISQSTEWAFVIEIQAQLKIITGRSLYPNAAAITAAVANILKLPKYMEIWFFLAGRSAVWLNRLTS